ncbi:MAG: PorT family protein [Fibrobacter sp.]|nr:PorT family protein [Fibrobacter sp.]
MKKLALAALAALALGTSVSAQSIEDFYAKPVRVGGHAALGVSGTYDNEKALGNYRSGRGYEEGYRDPFEGYLGVNGNFGGIALVRLNNLITLAPELSFSIKDYFKESEVWSIEVQDRYGYHDEPVDENMMVIGVALPIMVRFTPVPQLYLEAGAQMNFNLLATFTLDNSDYDYSEDLGDWKVEPFGLAVNLGAGFTIPVRGHFMELGVRFMLDLTRIESDELILNPANESYRYPVETKGWHLQLVYNYFI